MALAFGLVALALTRTFPWRTVPAYVVAQLVGAVLASLVVWGVLGSAARDDAALAPRPTQRARACDRSLAHGGTSSGYVHIATWRRRLIPLLLARARALHDYSFSRADEFT